MSRATEEIAKSVEFFEGRREAFDRRHCPDCLIAWTEYDGVIRGLSLALQTIDLYETKD